MTFTIERVAELRDDCRNKILRLDSILNDRGASADRGTRSNALIGALRFEAIASYLLDHDIIRFRSLLGRCVTLKAALFDAKHRGEDVMPHLVTLGDYGFIYYGYAANQPVAARHFAGVIAGPTEHEDFNCASMALICLVRGQRDQAIKYVRQSLSLCHDKVFFAYTNGLRSIIELDQPGFNDSLLKLFGPTSVNVWLVSAKLSTRKKNW